MTAVDCYRAVSTTVVDHLLSAFIIFGLLWLLAIEIFLRARARRKSRGDGAKRLRRGGLDVQGYVILPFGKVLVSGCTTEVLRLTPPAGVRLFYLVVPKRISADFEIVSLMIGKNSQLAGSEAIPGDVFSGELQIWGEPPASKVGRVILDHPVELELENPDGREVELRVQNLNPYARTFTAVMFGKRISD